MKNNFLSGNIYYNRIAFISFFGHFKQRKAAKIYYKVYPKENIYTKQLQTR